jgi:hypothetical protein
LRLSYRGNIKKVGVNMVKTVTTFEPFGFAILVT